MIWHKIFQQLKVLFILLVVFPLTLPTILITQLLGRLVRGIVWLIAKSTHPEFHSLVSGPHLHFTFGEADNFPLNSFALGIVEGNLTTELTSQKCLERVINLRDAKGNFVYEGLKRYWRTYLGFPFWVEDPNFRITNHVRYYDETGSMALPAPCNEDDIKRIMGDYIRKPWKKNQSPWEFLIVNNLNGFENRSGLIFKFDHSICDGISILKTFEAATLCSFTLPKFKLSERSRSRWERLGLFFKMPYDTLMNIELAKSLPRLPSRAAAPSSRIIFSATPVIDVDVIKSVKEFYGVRYGAILYAMIVGAIEKALQESGEEVPNDFLSNVVVPWPDHPGGLCIHAGVIFAKLPLKMMTNQVERLFMIEKNLAELNDSTAGIGNILLTHLIRPFSSPVMAWISRRMYQGIGVSVGITNLPVTTEPVHFEGMEMSDLLVGNSPFYTLGMVITMSGTNNKQRVAFSVSSNFFKSEEIARNLGENAMKELQLLIDGMT